MSWQLHAADILSETQRILSQPYLIKPTIALATHAAGQILTNKLPPAALKNFRRVVPSTIDRQLQQNALAAVKKQLLILQHRHVHDGCVLAVENKTGNVLAYVGGAGVLASASLVDGIKARRQAGSTLKPFLYALAIEQRIVTAATLLDDSPVDIPVSNGMYRPRNYDMTFHGLVTVRTALASSLNVPAVKVLTMIGVEPFWRLLRTLGFSNLERPDYYGPSLALGSLDVSLWDLVNAYRVLANAGNYTELRFLADEQVSQPRQAISAEAAFVVSDILSDRESRSLTFGLDSPLATRFWTAVKTGTSKDMRDNWCIGYSSDFTVGAWVGNFDGTPMWNVSGMTGAAPIWLEVMNALQPNATSQPPKPPANLVEEYVQFQDRANQQREWFLAGTETQMVKALSNPMARIVYPAAGAIVALDPDIKPAQQQMFFQAEPKRNNHQWQLDDRLMGSANQIQLWALVKGYHVLKLLDEQGQPVDSISFEVR